MEKKQIQGLSTREVSARHKKFGYNELPNRDKKNFFKIIMGILAEPMIFLLIATVGIYFLLGSWDEACLLLFSFFGIIGIGLYQESKTEKSLEALRNLSSPISVVVRGGKRITIPGREVVVGDIIILSEGSRVPADAKLISAENLKVDESLLTGESVSVQKHTREITDYRTNSIFSGTLVVDGHGIAEVTSIGLDTEIGKIGKSLKSIGVEKTLLQRDVNHVVKLVAIMAISASLLLALVYWLQRGDLVKGLLAGLTLAIAILPEEFPVVLTIFLTLGAWRLAKNNILARRAHTIETLGSASVLCVDKTGTLTENRMKIMNVIDADSNLYNDNFDSIAEIIEYGVLACQKSPYDPMEEAFIAAGESVFKNIDDVYAEQEIIKEYPLSEKSLSVAYAWGDDKIEKVALKGAPEAVFELCNLDDVKKATYERDVISLAESGLRVIAIAKGLPTNFIPKTRDEFDFEFLGLVGLTDPIRTEVPSAVELCKNAGIRVVMITGDYPETAASIASKIGLDISGIVTGAQFEKMSDSDRKSVIETVSVFSRVSPANKLTIVNAFKKAGEIVVMTGDGVNDAPALKSAHVGIAMGKKGTDVAREAASIVLLDDNFASIVSGVRVGRRIYDNLRKAMSYIISIHIPIAALSLLPVLFKWPLILTPIHIVFLEFIIDPSCSIIFENEKEGRDIMKRAPRKLDDSIFNMRMVLGNVAQGMLIAVAVVIVFGVMLTFGYGEDKARGITFLILIVANILLVLVISGKQSLANIVHRENMAMLVILSVTAISLVLLFNVPFLLNLFNFAPVSFVEVSVGIFISVLVTLGAVPVKLLINKNKIN